MLDCPHCGTTVPAREPLLPGVRTRARRRGARLAYRRRWPPEAFHIVVALVAVGGIILLAGGAWAWGLVVLLLAALLFLSQREAERRAAQRAWGNFRARFSATREAVAARSRGQLDLFRARRDRAELEAEADARLPAPRSGGVLRGQGGHEGARDELDGVAQRITEKEAEIDTMLKEMEQPGSAGPGRRLADRGAGDPAARAGPGPGAVAAAGRGNAAHAGARPVPGGAASGSGASPGAADPEEGENQEELRGLGVPVAGRPVLV